MEIGASAFYGTDLEGTLAIPAKLTKIRQSAFSNTAELAGLDLSARSTLDRLLGTF